MKTRSRFLNLIIPVGAASILLLSIISFFSSSGVAAEDNTVLAQSIEIGPAQAKNAEPGDTVTYTYWMTNGTTSETYNLSADNAGGWATALSTNTVPMGNGDSISFVLTLTVPSTATSGPVLTTISVIADDNNPQGSENNTTTVAAHPAVAMAALDDSLSGSAGEIVTYTLHITNTGNAHDNYSITASGGSNGFTTTAQSQITVDAYKSGQFEVYVEIPPGSAADTIDTATITATSTVSASLSVAEQLATKVNKVSNVSITPSQLDKDGLPGQQVVYTHLVNNDGNFDDTYNIVYSSTYQVQLSTQNLFVEKDDSKPLTVTVTVPNSALSNTVNVTVVTATSSIDSQSYAAAQDITTVVLAPGVSIVKNESGTADPGSYIEYVHTVTNLGNGRDNFNAYAVSNQGYSVQVTPANFSLNSSAFRLVTVKVNIPSETPGGIVDKTTVTVESKKNSSVNDKVIDTTTVNGHQIFIPLAYKASEWNQVGATTWKSGDAATAVDVCAADSSLIFAGTQEELRLFDGSSWKTPSGTPKGYTIASIVLSADCESVYFVVYKSSTDPDVAGHGVWEGTLNSQNSWNFKELIGGVDVTSARKVAVSGGTLFAGGGFGIAYWDQGQWKATNVQANPSHPIMDLTVADNIKNIGPLYAVQWINDGIISNMNPKNQPGQWAMLAGLAPLPDSLVRAVAGDAKNVRYVGTSSHHYKLVGSSWQQVHNQTTRALLVGAVDYAGYTGARDPVSGDITDPGDGVYRSTDNGLSFTPYNEGWKPPQDVINLESNSDYIFAATSAGVFKR